MPDTFGNITAAEKLQYGDIMRLQVQQTESKLLRAVSPLTMKGKDFQAVEIFGKQEAQIDAPERSESPDMRSSHLGIWVRPKRITTGGLLSRGEAIRVCTDVQAPLVKSWAAAHNRAKDAIIAAAFFGVRRIKATESDVPSDVAFAGSAVPVNYAYGGGGSNSGLTVPKIIRGLTLMGVTDFDVDMANIKIAMTMKQNEDLYNDIKVISKDYQNRTQLDDKFVRSLMGIECLIYNGMPTDGSGYRRVALFAEEGMHAGNAGDGIRRVGENPAREFQVQIFNEDYFGATRSEDEKVVEIKCLEA